MNEKQADQLLTTLGVIADTLINIEINLRQEKPAAKKPAKKAPAKKPAEEPTAEVHEFPKAGDNKGITRSDIRKALEAVDKACGRDVVKATLAQFKARSLTGIREDDYEAVIAQTKSILAEEAASAADAAS